MHSNWVDYDPEEQMADARRRAVEAANVLLEKLGLGQLDVAFVMGSGWAEAADGIGETKTSVSVADLPGFVVPTAAGHRGEIRAIEREGGTAAIFVGRTHLYEGYGPLAVAHGVRTAVAAGARQIVLTNACGGLNPAFDIGRPVLIRDHINFTATTPLIGANFVDLTDLYSNRLREICRTVDPSLKEGVYGGWFGPAFETPAEIEMMRVLGCDMVGMSTVLEAIAAHAEGAEVLGLSLVTNQAAGMSGEKLSGDEVLQVAKAAIPGLRSLLGGIAGSLLG